METTYYFLSHMFSDRDPLALKILLDFNSMAFAKWCARKLLRFCRATCPPGFDLVYLSSTWCNFADTWFCFSTFQLSSVQLGRCCKLALKTLQRSEEILHSRSESNVNFITDSQRQTNPRILHKCSRKDFFFSI